MTLGHGLLKGLASVADTWGQGGNDPLIFWKTIVFCSKTIEIYDVIFSKNRLAPPIFGQVSPTAWHTICLSVTSGEFSKH